MQQQLCNRRQTEIQNKHQRLLKLVPPSKETFIKLGSGHVNAEGVSGVGGTMLQGAARSRAEELQPDAGDERKVESQETGGQYGQQRQARRFATPF